MSFAREPDALLRDSMRYARLDAELDADFERIYGKEPAPPANMQDPAYSPPPEAPPAPMLKPYTGEGSLNVLRPRTLEGVVGQERLKPLLRRLIDAAVLLRKPLSHLLFVGAAGTGKTTLATVIAHEVGTRTFVLEAPLDRLVLDELRQVARDRDIIFVDEIHKQVSGDRRGLTQACDPEAFYMLLEDGMLATPTGPKPFPAVTWIGATTDVGLMPVPLSDRFTIQPQLTAYTTDEMTELARRNAASLRLACNEEVYALFAGASRGIPRMVNRYMRAASDLTPTGTVTVETAREVVEELNTTTLDGLTQSMQTVLRYLYVYGRRKTRDGVRYQSSATNLATACGHGRDTKAINLLVEPYLIQRGLIQVWSGVGRILTDAGVQRARQLLGEE